MHNGQADEGLSSHHHIMLTISGFDGNMHTQQHKQHTCTVYTPTTTATLDCWFPSCIVAEPKSNCCQLWGPGIRASKRSPCFLRHACAISPFAWRCCSASVRAHESCQSLPQIGHKTGTSSLVRCFRQQRHLVSSVTSYGSATAIAMNLFSNHVVTCCNHVP